MHIKSISIEGYRSIGATQRIDSIPDSGVIGITGSNVDTGGSSGSGKSTFFKAINYALGIDPKDASWHHNRTQVDLGLNINGTEYLIRRGNISQVIKDGVTIADGGKETTTKVSELLKFSPDVIKSLTYRPQQTPGLFLSLSDTEKKSFLVQVLQLSDYEKVLEELEVLIPNAKNNEHLQRAVLESKQQSIGPMLVPPTEPDLSSEASVVRELAEVQDLAATIASTINQCNLTLSQGSANSQLALQDSLEASEIATCKATKVIENAELTARGVSLQDVLDAMNEQLTGANTAYNTLAKIHTQVKSKIEKLGMLLDSGQSEIAKIDKHIASAQSNVCPTCNQEWHDNIAIVEEMQFKLAAHNAELEKIKQELKESNVLEQQCAARLIKAKEAVNGAQVALSSAQSNIQAHKEEVAKLQYQHAQDVAAQVAAIKKKFDDIKSDIILKTNATNALTNAQKNAAIDQMQIVKGRIKTLQSQHTDLENSKQWFKAATEAYEQALVQFRSREAAAAAQVAIVESAVLEYNSLCDLQISIKAFIGKFSAMILDEIAGETNLILSNIKNVGNLYVEFATQRTTQKGTVRQEIKPIFKIGANEIALKDLSGGQRTAAYLATDLAVSTVVSRRNNGELPQWLIFDESFEGLDVVTKEQALDTLRNYASDKLIMLVDHASELKEAADVQIMVTGSISVPTTLRVIQ